MEAKSKCAAGTAAELDGRSPRIPLMRDASISVDAFAGRYLSQVHTPFREYGPTLKQFLEQGLNAFTFGPYWAFRRTSQRMTVWPEGGGEPEKVQLEPLSDEFAQFMEDYFHEWAKFLRANDAMDEAYVYVYDEPAPGEYDLVNQLMAIVRKADPEFRIVIPGIPGRQTVGRFPDLGISCPLLPSINQEHTRRVRQGGKEPWFYICLSPRHPFPNFFIDYPAIDHRIVFWMAWKYDIDGFLYWQTTHWSTNPWENPETYPTTHGDGCLFYPARKTPIEVIGSIRLQTIRDGVEDYDYFALLEGLVDRAGRSEHGIDPALLDHARQLLAIDDTLVEKPDRHLTVPGPLLERRRELGETISRLVRELP